jgi:hypothetical protein
MDEERAIVLPSWPQSDSGAPMPSVVADESSLFVRYYTKANKVAVVHFCGCSDFMFGSPNDETLNGHRLYGRGLGFYSVHSVENSTWIAQLEESNSVHPRHDKQRFLEDKKHYIFTFHNSTLECVVEESARCPTIVSEFADVADADSYIQSKRRA